MKLRNYKCILMIVALVGNSFLPNTSTAEGGFDGGGGNAQVAEFYDMAKKFHREIFRIYKEKVPDFPVGELTAVMSRYSVESTPGQLTLRDGQKVDAINNPNSGVIYLDDVSWAQRDQRLKFQIVIHELLGLMRIEDFQYEQSKHLADITIGAIRGHTPHENPETRIPTPRNPFAPFSNRLKFERVTVNFDRSVTVFKPMIYHLGEWRRIGVGHILTPFERDPRFDLNLPKWQGNRQPEMIAICGLLRRDWNFKAFRVSPNVHGWELAYAQNNGSFSDMLTSKKEVRVVDWVTCVPGY